MSISNDIQSLCEQVKTIDRDILQKEQSLKNLRVERRKMLSKIYRLEKKQEASEQPKTEKVE